MGQVCLSSPVRRHQSFWWLVVCVVLGVWAGQTQSVSAEPAMKPELCRPCSDNQACGSGGHCWGAGAGAGVCLQACESDGSCPATFTCNWLAPGVKKCFPKDGLCKMTCGAKRSCPTGYSCKNDECEREQGGQFGDLCSTTQPCATGFYCLEDGSKVKRCATRCGPPLGEAGSPCKTDGSCNTGLSCVPYSNKNVCVKACSDESACKGSGMCNSVNGRSKGCTCRQDSDCVAGEFCNKGVLQYQGACLAESLKGEPGACGAGRTCQPLPGHGYLCLPSREKGQPRGYLCSPFVPCKDGLVCRKQTPSTPALCYEECNKSLKCDGQEICSFIGRVGQYCLCKEDKQCPNGFNCYMIPDAAFQHGVCRPGATSSCSSSDACPSGYSCDKNVCTLKSQPGPEPGAGPEANSEPPTPREKVASEPAKTEERATGQEFRASDESSVSQEPAGVQDAGSPELPNAPAACGCNSGPSAPWFGMFGMFFVLLVIRLRLSRS